MEEVKSAQILYLNGTAESIITRKQVPGAFLTIVLTSLIPTIEIYTEPSTQKLINIMDKYEILGTQDKVLKSQGMFEEGRFYTEGDNKYLVMSRLGDTLVLSSDAEIGRTFRRRIRTDDGGDEYAVLFHLPASRHGKLRLKAA